MNDAFLQNLTFANVAAAVWRHKGKATLFALLFLAVVAAVLLMLPRKYESTGKMFVQLGRGGVTLDPTATTSKNILVQDGRESEINSVIDVVQSRGVLEKVVDQEGIDKEILESRSILGDLMPNFSFSSKEVNEKKDLKERDKAVRELASAIGVRAPRKAAVVTISCRTESSELSQKIVRVLMDTYLKEHVKARQTEGSFSFFQEAFKDKRAEVEKLAGTIEKYKNEIGVMSIEGRQAALREHIAEIEAALLKATAEFTGYSSEYDSLKKLAESVPEKIELESTDGVANQASDLMKDRLFSLKVETKDLMARLGPNNPRVKAKQDQLRQAESELKKQSVDRTQVRRGVNTTRQKVDLAMIEARANTEAAQATMKKLDQELEDARSKMEGLNVHETTLAALYRDREVSEKAFAIYSEKLEEARINRELDQKNISNVKIVQPATLQIKHVSPKYGLILLASGIFALISAVCVAIFAEQADSTLRTDQQVEQNFGVEVISSIPTVGHRSVHVTQGAA